MPTPLPQPGFRSQLRLRGITTTSIFRTMQEAFVREHGAAVTGSVVELGGELHYRHRDLFPEASAFIVTNIGRDCDRHLDLTAMDLPDASQDAYLCTSVLEHVDDIGTAISEIARTLRPGGILILTIPFLYPIHDTHDSWRVARDGFPALLGDDLEIETFDHLGGRVSVMVALCQRPVQRWERRDLPYKILAALLVLLLGRFDRIDDAPLGYGLVVRRRAHP